MKSNESPTDLIKHKHRHELIFQILVPILIITIGVLLLLVFVILSSFTSPENNQKWADISLVMLISPLLLLGIFSIGLLITLCILTYKLHGLIPGSARKIREEYGLLTGVLEAIALKTSNPLVSILSFSAGLKKLTHIAQQNMVDRRKNGRKI